MASMNIYLKLNDDHEGDNAPAFAHDLIKYQIEQLMIENKIVNFEWEIVE
jgi:hypothetical protein